jgi:small subunit ribosomal protein S16
LRKLRELPNRRIKGKVSRLMLKIRMQRSGRINQPSFKIVVTEHTSSPKAGKYVERVGFYNPTSKERTLVEDRIKYWMSVGAKPSGTVHNMLVSAGLLNAKKINVLPKKTVGKTEEPAAEAAVEAPAAEAAAETAAETPAEEVKEETPEKAE